MNSVAYSIDFSDTVLTHGRSTLALLHDGVDGSGADFREYTQADALAVSGDYFMVLATRLDALSQRLPVDSPEYIEVEHLIQTLFYLQKHYSIVPNHKLR